MRLSILASALLFASMASQALADDAAPNARKACMSSARTFCATEIAARDRQAVKLCLWKNLDKVTPDCRAAINAAIAAHGATPTP